MIRIRPQQTKDEKIHDLVEDPWKTLACTGDADGCMVEFDDQTFGSEKREYIYYVRAVEKPTPTVNAGNLRCEKDANGVCVSARRRSLTI